MRNRTNCSFYILIFFLLFGGCNFLQNPRCEILANADSASSRLFLHLKSLTNKSCLFYLGSSYFEIDSSWVVKIDNKELVVNMDGDVTDMDVLLRFDDSIGKERGVSIRHSNWSEGKGDEKITTQVSVKLINKIKSKPETFFVLKFQNIVFTDFSEGRRLDAFVFFSNKKGFVGSYYIDPLYSKWIIQKEGNILENEIDYSGYTFRRFR
ncbi:MAG: hypothetical protein GVY26_00060 [Bacteroidetes bacterium]|jgi:hypothetical protein|nr:hypothetical protein [Bacteroidota bacterium]